MSASMTRPGDQKTGAGLDTIARVPAEAVQIVTPSPARAGEVQLDFRSVYAEHVQFVARLARHLGVPDSDVDDVCQDVFVVVQRRLHEFEGRSALRTWLYHICWRTVRVHLRRVRRADHRTSLRVEVPAPGTGPENEMARTRAREQLNLILGQLDPDKRAVFVLYEIEELSMREVGEILGCPLQTGYSRLKAAHGLVRRYAQAMDMEKGDEP